MKIAIISDIHGNLEALQAVLNTIDVQGFDRIDCLGDVIGYGPDPVACLDLVRQRANIILAGNHDYAPIGKTDVSNFNRYAREAVNWTGEQLSAEDREFIAGLPLTKVEGDIVYVHASPGDPLEWDYIFGLEDAIDAFPQMEGRVCFVGHSHVPGVFVERGAGQYGTILAARFELEREFRYIINVGSVGQPRDLNPYAAFGAFDTKESTYQLIRVKYDLEKTQQKINAVGLPSFLADRLMVGR